MTSGQMHDEAYFQHFGFLCPRPKKEDFLDCLVCKFQSIIDNLIHLKVFDKNNKPIWINQFIKGRTGSRVFRKEIIDTYIAELEKELKKELRKTEEGIAFYRKNKGNAIRFLIFCILNQKIIRERTRSKKSLSERKSKIIHLTLHTYHLEGDKSVNDATIQKIEELLIKREKKNALQNKSIDEQILTNTEESNSKDTQLEISDNDYLENWDELTREEETLEPIIFEELPKEVLESLDVFNIEKYFLEGDPEMTETLIDYCPKNEKKDVTCDVLNDVYWLAARKIIHLFIYQNELFKKINLSTNCLAEQTVDVTELRRLVELFIRKNTSWELSKAEKNKFVLCTICHLIRHFKLLGKLDTLDGIKAFFEYKGRIFQLSEKNLQKEQGEAMKILQKLEPQVIDNEEKSIIAEVTQLPQKVVIIPTLHDSDRLEDLKVFLTEVAQKADLSLVPIEIIRYKEKANELIRPEEYDENFEWVDIIFQYKDDTEFLPFLAEEVLQKLQLGEEQKIKSEEETHSNVSLIENNELLEKSHQKCKECMQTIPLAECAKKKALVEKTANKGIEAMQKLWEKDKKLRPCIANQLLKEK